MFAVVKSGGRQFKAALGTVLELEKLPGNVGDVVELQVLFAGAGVSGKVNAEILKQGKGDKVIIFKKRRRHNSRRKNGHRQHLTTVQIVELGGKKIEEKNKRKIITRTAPVKMTKEQKAARDQKIAAKTSQAKLDKAVKEEKAAKPAKAKTGEAKPAKKKPAVNTSAKPEAHHAAPKNQNAGGAKPSAPRKVNPGK